MHIHPVPSPNAVGSGNAQLYVEIGSRETQFGGSKAADASGLGGGLNNMLMNVAQLLHDSCGGGRHGNTTLVLPQLTSGWRFFKASQPGSRIKESVEFGDVFDAAAFAQRVAPCRVAEVAPVGVAVQEAAVVGINRQWPYEAWLPLVYGALAPSRKLQPAVAQMVRRAAAGGGPRWAAVHLRIERDWWVISGFCTARRFPHRRCYPPSEVASLTAASRLRRNVSGVVLIYAADNVARSGPEVRPEQFGARVLSLPSAPESTGH